MGFISRKQIKAFRTFILSPKLENILLVVFLFTFALIVSIKIDTMDGSAIRQDQIKLTSYRFYHDLKRYYIEDEFEQIKSIDDFYDYLLKILNDKLWLPLGKRSPNWPIGGVRLLQHRVRSNKNCGKNPTYCNELEGEELLTCLKNTYSNECNFLF